VHAYLFEGVLELFSTGVLECQLDCMLRERVLSCRRAYVEHAWSASVLAFSRVYLHACLLASMLACRLACVPACMPPRKHNYTQRSKQRIC
jgi:hypothetical protein